jgi:uncharacterized repeat protein (TIGR02543 family)
LPSLDYKSKGLVPALRVAGRTWRRARRSAPSIAVAVVVLVLLTSALQPHLGPPAQSSHPTGVLSLSPQGGTLHPDSIGLAAADPANAAVQSPPATYDEQMSATFIDNFTSLAYNVTVLAQTDAYGYGPAYLLNGLTSDDYFYQVGVSYHWPTSPGVWPTYGFSYQVFGPSGSPVYPTTGGSGLENFSSTVNSGDSFLLSLTFTGSTVQMLAHDWNTGATAMTNYSSFGSSSFIGNPSSTSNFQGYFTGLMTEWYHVAQYSGTEVGVSYTNNAVALTSAWMWIDEFDTGSGGAGPHLFSDHTRATFANDQQVYPFSADGTIMYISAHQFITGLPATASSSKVTIVPAAKETSTPGFSAAYTLSGHPQTVSIAAGTTILAADPGTSITISLNSVASPSDRWVFNGTTGTKLTVAAGSNATYVLYHLVREVVSYQVAAGGQALPQQVLELRYEVPPPIASTTTTPVVATQVFGTEPVVIFAILGSEASINGTVPGAAGERWIASSQRWTITGSGLVPFPIEFYQQFEVSIGYSIAGGGTPSRAPVFTAASLGSLTTTPLSSAATTGWFDAGSAYFFTSVVNGSSGAERWLGSGGAGLTPSVISLPNQALSEVYTHHQYYARLTVNDASGGTVSKASGWFDPGSTLTASALANKGWDFKGWSGSGASAYTGTSPSLNVVVDGSLNEDATFYVQLAITADPGTNIAFSSPSQTGTVQAGTTKILDIPPSNVTLRAAPSFFVYSFASWQGAGVANVKTPSLVLAVDSPTTVAGTSSYDNRGVLVLVTAAAAVAINVLAGSLWLRGRRKKNSLSGFHSGLIFPGLPLEASLHLEPNQVG